jgi:hypothetical protein
MRGPSHLEFAGLAARPVVRPAHLRPLALVSFDHFPEIFPAPVEWFLFKLRGQPQG